MIQAVLNEPRWRAGGVQKSLGTLSGECALMSCASKFLTLAINFVNFRETWQATN